jgi:two-component system sensor histidine kinase ArlS
MPWAINGGMTKKLLYKSQQIYLIVAIIIFIIVAPIFYGISRWMYINNIDETLVDYKVNFVEKMLPKIHEENIMSWNKHNTIQQIVPYYQLKGDTIYYTTYFSEIEQELEPYRALDTPIKIGENKYIFTTKIGLFESEDLMISIAILFFVLMALLLIVLGIITNKISIKLWKPFYEILAQIEDFQIDNPHSLHLKKTDIEEFNRLNLSIEKLIQNNYIIYENQCEFVENAAHELQTPIAIFKGKIENLMQRSDITEGQAELLESINNSITRLKKLNKNLLMLSNIDKNNFNVITSFEIKEIIEKQLAFFKEQAIQKNIHIETDFIDKITITANKGFTEILCSNLLLNAIQHNIVNGKISIYITNNKLTISNTGTASSIKSESLFNRFSKTSTSEKGNGLGLAIVKKIVDINKWSISYFYENNTHLFTITF